MAECGDNKAQAQKKGMLGGLFCKKESASKCEEPKCPPMPSFDVGQCKPDWLCNPPKPSTKTYPAPPGVEITPISVGGRYGSAPVKASGGTGTCSACGRKEEPSAKPKAPSVSNKDCPMMKPRCPGKEEVVEKKQSGIFGKITSLFGGKTEEDEECNCKDDDMSVEDICKGGSGKEPKCQSISEDDIPFQFRNGKPVFEGGMSLDRAQRYLWAQNTCYDESFRKYGIEGQELKVDTPEPECNCEEHLRKKKYPGGQPLDDKLEWLWIKYKGPVSYTYIPKDKSPTEEEEDEDSTMESDDEGAPEPPETESEDDNSSVNPDMDHDHSHHHHSPEEAEEEDDDTCTK